MKILSYVADILKVELNVAQYMDYWSLKRMNDQFNVEKQEKRKEFNFMRG